MERHLAARGPVDARPPALDALGQGVVGTLLRHQAVGDARVRPTFEQGRVLTVEQPAPRGPAQRAADQLGGARASVVGAARRLHRHAGHREHVGRCGQEGDRGVGSRRRHPGGQHVGGDGDADVGAAVGIEVVADHEPAVETRQPVGRLRHLGEQVDAGVLGPGRHRDEQSAAGRAGGTEHPFPDRRRGQVDRGHGGAPAEQRSERAHLRPCAEHRDGPALEPEPLRVRGDLADRDSRRGLEHARALPRRELRVQVGPHQAPSAVRQHQLGQRLALAGHRERLERACGRCVRQRVQRTVAVGVGDDEATADGVQAGARDLLPCLWRRQAGLDQPPEVDQVATAPGGLVLGGTGPERVDRPQRLGHHFAGDLARRSAAVGCGRERDAVAHGTIMASGRAG